MTHNLNLEGAPKALLETCRCLRETGLIEPLIVSPVEGPLRAEYKSAGMRVVVGPTPFSGGPALREL